MRHRFLTAGDNDRRVTGKDLLHADGHRAQARAAQLVEVPGCRLLRAAGGHRRLACRILALTGGQNLAHDHLVDLFRIDARAFQRAANGGSAEFMRRHIRKRAVERTDRRARGACDNHRCHDGLLIGLRLSGRCLT
jgi:hypothetical protein